ncbi:MAG: hypothetical protein IT461_07650 [Planctomycetes bacterium]|nr:hypothetical protein [Planctomycetota bacterium]
MISNNEQLTEAREALEAAEAGLAALKARIWQPNPELFRAMADAPTRLIRQLRAQIDEYTGVLFASDTADFWIELEGPRVRLGTTSFAEISRTIEATRQGVLRLAEHIFSGIQRHTGRPLESLRQLCNLSPVALQPGSVRVGLQLANPANTQLWDSNESNAVSKAVEVLMKTLEWSASEENPLEDKNLPQSPDLRRLALQAVFGIAPRPSSNITSVRFVGRRVPAGAGFELTVKSRDRVRAAISTSTLDQFEEHEGVIRELDLDGPSFTLRERANGQPPLKCNYDGGQLEGLVKENIDKRVLLHGKRLYQDGLPKELFVENLFPVLPEKSQ